MKNKKIVRKLAGKTSAFFAFFAALHLFQIEARADLLQNVLPEVPAAEAETARPPYLKSATYYGDDWVINFWNLEDTHLDEDMERIAADGFNSIILAVPWREFQINMDSRHYNQYAFDKLHRVMDAAERAGLLVMLRVGYTWDHAGQDNVLERYQQLIYEEDVRNAWLDYAGLIYQAASCHRNFYGGFLTWEDFWNFTHIAGDLGNTPAGRELAGLTGYRDYLKGAVALEEASRQYGEDFSDWQQVYLPEREQEAYGLFLEFYDNWLNRILLETQEVFPNLSMEVRTDVDPITMADGHQTGFSHAATFNCQNSSFTSLMYSVSMGMEARNHHMSAAQVLPQTGAVLDWVTRYNGGKPLYIDQFLFTDNTPGFEENPKLDEVQMPDYLIRCAPILKEKTMGYGIWTYRDYGNNMIYNSQFGLGKTGWTSSGRTQIVNRDGSNQLELEGFGRISQTVNPAGSAVEGELVKVRFLAESPPGAAVTVKMGARTKTIRVQGKQQVYLEFPKGSLGEFSISSDSALYVDNIQVYTHVTEGKLYDMDGNPEICLEAIRILNGSL